LRDADPEYVWTFRSEYPAVLRTVVFIVSDRGRAEDITQEAFIQLLTNWRKVARYDRPGAWVRRVAIRLAVRDSKRERRRAELEATSADAGALPFPDIDLQRAVHSLPTMQRATTVLFYFEDRPVAEIVDILGISEGSVKVHLHRARLRLAERLDEVVSDDAG
jgi:DNA-directed RNA polymerase specialized sigma24 family protein